jgi:uncharacterized protein (DUF2147 family)
MKVHPIWVAALLLLPAFRSLQSQQSSVLDYWKEPGGSIIHVEMCGNDVCATLVAISPTAPGRIDAQNPDASLRSRTLCGVRIGEAFQLKTPTRAEGGRLYDPKSGKTYRGLMESHGNDLNLRGYIGFSLLGRTEKWSRTAAVTTCQK